MSLSPKAQYKIVFWIATFPIFLVVMPMLAIAAINPFWFRESLLSWSIRTTESLGQWRDRIAIVKYYQNKMNLFNILKD